MFDIFLYRFPEIIELSLVKVVFGLKIRFVHFDHLKVNFIVCIVALFSFTCISFYRCFIKIMS